ncbi:hypothetical protein, partial [Mesotoga sp. UBA5557]|uniref:hypothetical protein n=1 Tax=Mesotoga sp. UBA5557 TaxID=1946857 RepID=UPI0025F1D35D
ILLSKLSQSVTPFKSHPSVSSYGSFMTSIKDEKPIILIFLVITGEIKTSAAAISLCKIKSALYSSITPNIEFEVLK